MLSIISCASGRVPLFAMYLESLAHQDGANEVQYCLATWGDDRQHKQILGLLGRHFANVQYAHIETEDHWPLPKAYNAALAMAEGESVMVLGSEVILESNTLPWIAPHVGQLAAYARIIGCIDEQDGRESVGRKWKGAFPYCMTLATQHLLNIGGWDEVMGKGIAFDDPDLTVRLLMDGVTFRWNFDLQAVHQSHTKVGNEQPNPDRGKWKAINEAEFVRRLGDIPVTEIWPCWWPDGKTPTFPEDDGVEIQEALRQRLLKSDYPRRAVETAIA